MSYPVFPASQAVRRPDRPDVLGYLFNDGGLSNQKMALAGLLLTAAGKHLPVTLPYLHIKDHRGTADALARFGDIYDLASLRGFTDRHGLRIDDGPPASDPGGWPYFFAFSQFLAIPSLPEVARMALDALSALRPRMDARPELSALKGFVLCTLGVRTVLQLRIESDWPDYASALQSAHGVSDDVGIDFPEILRRVANTFPGLGMAYVTTDESILPVGKDAIRAMALDRFGIRLIWKSDLIALSGFNALDLSILDFELARDAPRFIGQSFSSFANLACLEKFARQRRPVRGHFIYNHPGDTVRERLDNGLASASPQVVTANWTDGLWMSANAA
ncbi:hypothetical protein [Rhodopila sp.]|uniref:hypothetical protein n=1 Tax=Rhodopila sp. TaxID=2480087 RepID=UPI002B7C758C|nr:hypothetical protein [Rhodopila sp.]HVZ06862.1 hypothetical protein [Rhodopila sp.]